MGYPFQLTRTSTALLHTPGRTGASVHVELLPQPMGGVGVPGYKRFLREAPVAEPEQLGEVDGSADGTRFRISDYVGASGASDMVPESFHIEVEAGTGNERAYSYLLQDTVVENVFEQFAPSDSSRAASVEAALAEIGESLAVVLVMHGRRLSRKGFKMHANLPKLAGWELDIDTSSEPWEIRTAKFSER